MEASAWQGAWGEAWTCHRRLQADPDPTTGAAVLQWTARAEPKVKAAEAEAKAKETGRGHKVARDKMVAVDVVKVVATVRRAAEEEEEAGELEALVAQATLELQQHPKRQQQRVQRKTLMGTSTPARALSMWCA